MTNHFNMDDDTLLERLVAVVENSAFIKYDEVYHRCENDSEYHNIVKELKYRMNKEEIKND
jgi:hypothetical protein